jgi:hypothetical protein
MKYLPSKYIPYLILAILSIPLFFMNIYDVHSWGDDFAQYIKEGLNFAHRKPWYQSGYVYNAYNTEYAPPQYPPGYPMLIAPIVKFWGISYRALAYFNTVITVGLLLALFAYFRKLAGKTASVCLSLAIVYSGYIVSLKANVLADTSCLLFVVLYLGVRNMAQLTTRRILLLIALAIAAALMRTQAMLLLVAEGIYFALDSIRRVFKTKQVNPKEILLHPSLLISIGGLCLFVIMDKVVFYSPLNTSVFYNQFIPRALGRPLMATIRDNKDMLLAQMTGFFSYETHGSFMEQTMTVVHKAGLPLIFAGFILSVWRRLTVDNIFFVLMCLLVLFLPVHDQRYFLPAIPLLFYYCYLSLRTIITTITKRDVWPVAVGLTLLYFAIGYQYLKSTVTTVPAGCIPQAKDFAAFDYIRQHVKDNELIVFVKPRLLTLYTDKKSINSAWQVPQSKNKEIFDSLQAKYMLVVDGLDDGYYKTYLHEIQQPIDSTRIAEGYTLYMLR